MVDSPNSFESFEEVEALLRSAANYVQVSKDLRPRVLEAARLNSGERRIRHFIQQAALAAALLMWCVTASVDRLDLRDDLRNLSLAAAASPVAGQAISSGTGDGSWELVDAYTELRVRQAGVLRLKL